MTVGAAGAINAAIKALFNPGEELISPSPYFVEYGGYAANHGGKLVAVPSTKDFRLDLAGIEAVRPDRLVISPGPCSPEEAGISVAAIRHFAGKIPILGVCLGHQSLGAAFGGRVIRAPRLMHGKTSLIYHDGRDLFQGVPSPFEATRYHSLIVERETLPECLAVSAQTAVGEIMGLRHNEFSIYGVQFHPESILTKEGMNLLRNFLRRSRG